MSPTLNETKNNMVTAVLKEMISFSRKALKSNCKISIKI